MASTSQLLTVLAVLLFTVTVEAQNKYAGRVKACHDKDPNTFSNCFKELFHEIRPALASGSPKENIPPLDPLFIDDFHLEEKGAVIDIKATFNNLTVIGASKLEFQEINFHKANKSMTGTLKMPALFITGLYAVDGELLLLPVNGKGPMTLNLTNINVNIVGYLNRKGGVLKMDKIDLHFKIEIMKINMENLGGGGAVDDALQKAINDNGQDILEDLRPQLEEKVTKIILPYFEGAFETLPESFGI